MKFEKTLIKFFPKSLRLPIKYQYHKIRNRLEKEIFYLEQLIGTCKRAMDIGANVGIYSYALAQIYDTIEVFETKSWCTENIPFYSQTSACNISVHNVGLANFNGSLTLHVPTSLGDYSQLVRGLGSFREIKGEQISIDIPVGKLDDYKFKDVSFMKIDVEGYETKVSEGPHNTIITEEPIIFMEVEQKHLNGKSIEDVFEHMLDLGYECSFI
ncbi:FkbM family methyltransferase [Nostoc sp. NMS8]|uniref:FkbM family methyltransferase n=1 Tax=Nostoc sp. NMS8 TaxID=2815392 RepID=UPI0025EC19C2|nr:FkbM family methyltransferase [Nostoc sp. NMS8]MBN3962672.1 FkbM family methyltransferase [Nostoc sp. NMS8]